MINIELLTRHDKNYCCEDISKIENYNKAMADTTQTWDCHHRLELQNGNYVSWKKLKKDGLYYNRPASELIFLTKSEHRKLHCKIKPMSEEVKKQISQTLKGKYVGEKHPMYGKHFSDETKRKMSEAHKGRKMSEEAHKKVIGVNNPFYGKTHSEETKEKMRQAWVRRKQKQTKKDT